MKKPLFFLPDSLHQVIFKLMIPGHVIKVKTVIARLLGMSYLAGLRVRVVKAELTSLSYSILGMMIITLRKNPLFTWSATKLLRGYEIN